MSSTTIEIPLDLRNQLQRLKRHPRQAYHEVIRTALARAALEGSTSGTSEDPLLAKHKSSIAKHARMHGLRNVRVFGSRARGDARPDSDLDLLFELVPGRTLLDVMAFANKVEALIGVPIHPAELEEFRPAIREGVRAEARPL